MANCLIGLGSNLGDRTAALQAALSEIDSLPLTQLVRHSGWHAFPTIGGPSHQPDFLNAAAVVETSLTPFALFEQLAQIEIKHGRRRAERWAARTLDIDLLLYEDRVVDTPSLVVPHPRMSYRRFVLQPAAEIASDMVHPIIGWKVSQLAGHLDWARDWAAIVSQSQLDRRELCELAITRFGAKMIEPPILSATSNEALWPRSLTTWLAFPEAQGKRIESTGQPVSDAQRQFPEIKLPKLTILVDAPTSEESGDSSIDWPKLRQQPGRGPTLWVRTADRAEAACELSAAIESVWTHLGRQGDTRVE
jgi:2-amino-4-hydroxy-6-hydroxymethyldihydropteridine diphosphokinase